MANSLFAAMKQCAIGDAAGPGLTLPNWESGDFRATLVDHGTFTPNVNTSTNYGQVTAGARIATMASSMTSKTTVLSSNTITMDAADVTYTAVSGASAESIVIYAYNATEANALLCVYFDTGVTGLPVTPNGGDITIQWNASGIWTW